MILDKFWNLGQKGMFWKKCEKVDLTRTVNGIDIKPNGVTKGDLTMLQAQTIWPFGAIFGIVAKGTNYIY